MRSSLLFALAAGLVVACGGGGSPTVSPTDAPPATDAIDTTVSPPTDAPSVTDVIGATAPTTDEPEPVLLIDEQGFETVPVSWGGVGVTAAAEAANTTGRYIQSMSYATTFRDAAGTVLHEGSGSVLGVPPGAVAVLQDSTTFAEGVAAAASVEFVLDPPLLTDGEAFSYADSGPIDLRRITVEIGDPRVSADYTKKPRVFAVVRNTGSDRIQELPYQCVFRRGGVITGAAIGSLAELLPGGTAGLSVRQRFDGAAPPDDVRCTVNPTNLTRITGPTDRGVEIVGSGFTTATRSYAAGSDALAAVLLRNPGTDALAGVRVQVDLYDSDGNLIEVGDVSRGYVLPGEEAVFAPIVVPGLGEAVAAEMAVGVNVESVQPVDAVVGVVGSDPFDLTSWTFGVAGARFDFNGTTSEFVGEVVNPQPVTVTGGLSVSCAFLLGGQVVGGQQFSGPSPVPPSGTAPFEVITTPFGSRPDHDEVRCTVHVNALFETEGGG